MAEISMDRNEKICGRQSASRIANYTVARIVCCWLMMASGPAFAQATPQEAGVATVHVDVTPGHVINSFDPDSTLGSSIDSLSYKDIDKVYTPHIIQESLSAGWGPISYRNNTELRMAAWHWTENGTWSDAAHRSGYFTASTELKGADQIHSFVCSAAPWVCHQRRSSGSRAEPHLLEKQSIPDQQIHRRKRCSPSPMGRRGLES